MPVVASVVAAKGGTGSSTVALNLAMALQARGRQVTVIDANTDTPDVGVMLGVSRVLVALPHVVKGQASIHEAVYKHESGINIIPSSIHTHDLTETHLKSLGHHIQQLRDDVIILDSKPSNKPDASHPRHHTSEAVIVTTADLPTVAHTRKTIKMLQQEGKRITGVIINRYGHQSDMRVNDIERFLEVPVIATIPEDDHVKQALAQKEAVVYAYPNAPASQVFNHLALYLTGESPTAPRDPIQRPSDESRPGNVDREIGTVSQFLNWVFGK